jgi:trk system potassium uptake protein TrkA
MSQEPQFGSLVVLAVAAFVVPLALALLPRRTVPTIVGEVVVGLLLGKSGLGWISPGPWHEFLFAFGLAFLLFLAGLEIDFGGMRAAAGGRRRRAFDAPLVIAGTGMAIRLALAFVVTVPLTLMGLLPGPTLVAFLLTSTSLGVVLTVLRERDILHKPFGQLIMVTTAVADFGTTVLLTIFFSVNSRSTVAQVALVVLLIVLGLAMFAGLRLAEKARSVVTLIERLAGSTAQIRVRGSFALLLAFTALAEWLGLQVILGAFIAGAIISALSVPREHPKFQTKIDATGYGFFVPVFFILTGARLDLPALLASPGSLVLVPILLIALVVVKMPSAWLFRRSYGRRECLAASALLSSQLTLTVAGVEIGKSLGMIDEALGSALVVVALLSVLIGPVAFARLLPAGSGDTTVRPA